MKVFLTTCLLTFLMTSLSRAENMVTTQVEVQVQFVQFQAADIDSLLAKDTLDLKHITVLREAGKGQLIALARLIGQLGEESQTKVVKEYIFPTEYKYEPYQATNSSSVIPSGGLTPSAFETREVGVNLRVVAERSFASDTLLLTITPECVRGPTPLESPVLIVGPAGLKQANNITQPIFEVCETSTRIAVHSGETVIASAGFSEDSTSPIFILIKATLVDSKAQHITSGK